MAIRKKIKIKKTAVKARTTAVKRSAKKKSVKKRTAAKKTKKKNTSTTSKSRSAKSSAGKKTVAGTRSRSNKIKAKKPLTVKPGPPAGTVPPVEEPASNEMAVGVITHYYSHIGVAVTQLNTGSLKTGDMIHVKGHTTDFTQTVASMEYEHQHIDQAGAGQIVGLKIIDQAREHDIVYRMK